MAWPFLSSGVNPLPYDADTVPKTRAGQKVMARFSGSYAANGSSRHASIPSKCRRGCRITSNTEVLHQPRFLLMDVRTFPSGKHLSFFKETRIPSAAVWRRLPCHLPRSYLLVKSGSNKSGLHAECPAGDAAGRSDRLSAARGDGGVFLHLVHLLRSFLHYSRGLRMKCSSRILCWRWTDSCQKSSAFIQPSASARRSDRNPEDHTSRRPACARDSHATSPATRNLSPARNADP